MNTDFENNMETSSNSEDSMSIPSAMEWKTKGFAWLLALLFMLVTPVLLIPLFKGLKDFPVVMPFMILVVLFLFYWAFGIFKQRNNYAIVSDRGVELNIYNDFSFDMKTHHDRIEWGQIEKCGWLYDGKARLVLKLKGEETPRIYYVGHLKEDGTPLVLSIINYLQQEFDKELERKSTMKVLPNLFWSVLMMGGFFLSFTLPIDETIIPYWAYLLYWVAVFGGAFLLRKYSKGHYIRLIMAAVSLFFYSVALFLWSNYHWTDWQSPDNIRSYPAVQAVLQKSKNGEPEGYRLKFEDEYGGYRSFSVGLEQEAILREHYVVDVYLHKGALGVPVYKKAVLRVVSDSSSGRMESEEE